MTNIYDQFDGPSGNPYDQFDGALPGGGVIGQPSQAIPGLDPVQVGPVSKSPEITAIEAEAGRQPTTLGGQLSRDVPRTARGLVQGATLTYSDEALAGIRSLLSGKPYGELLEEERAALEALGPARLPAEIVGSLPLAGKLVGRFVAPGTTTLGRAGRSAAVGGGTGTVTGFGSGEGGFGNRAENAAVIGGIGTLAGGSIPVLGRAGTATFRAVTDRLNAWFGGSGGRTSIAARQVAARIIKANPDISADEAFRRTKEELARLGPDARLIDTSDELTGLGGAVARAGGEPATVLKTRVRTRQEGTRDPETKELTGGQVGRTEAMLDRASPENPRLMGETLSRHDETTRQFYKGAFAANQSVDSPLIRRLVKTPEGKRALKSAVAAMNNEMKLVSKPDPELTALYNELLSLEKIAGKKTGVGVGRGFKLETLDLLKRELDSIAKAGRSPSASDKARARGKRAGVLATRLRNELDRLDETAKAGPKSLKIEGGEYARARARAKQRIEAREALKSGEHFLLKSKYRNDDELKAALDEMDPEQRHAFRVNAIQTLKDMAAGTKATHDVTKKLKGDRALERKIKLAFGDQETWENYIRFMDAEERMFKTYGEVFRGSQTAERIEEGARMRAGPSAGELVQMGASASRGNLGSLAVQAGTAIARSVGNMLLRARVPENVRREITEYLSSPQGIKELEAALQTRGALPASRGNGLPPAPR